MIDPADHRPRHGFRRRRRLRTSALLLLTTFVGCESATPAPNQAPPGPAPALPDSAFPRLVERLSGPGGFFDTDNLISNESSYLHVLGPLERAGVRGGAYIGVGPDQNFSYIAAVRPRIAFIVDIRSDNVLQHLIFKALFESAPTRAEYLALLLGRPVPERFLVEGPVMEGAVTERSVTERSVTERSVTEGSGEETLPRTGSAAAVPLEVLVRWFDSVPPDTAAARRARAVVDSAVATFGLGLEPSDLATLRRFHDAFIEEGLALRFRSFGRAPRPYYPTLRRLLLERDLAGRPASYLASEERYAYVREMQLRNLVVPVVGDLAGNHALPAIGALLEERGEGVSALYTSNVEFYLFRAGSFERFAEDVVGLPRTGDAVIVRSYFPSSRGRHPFAADGYWSTQLVQPLDAFAEIVGDDGFASYWELVTRATLDPRGGLRP